MTEKEFDDLWMKAMEEGNNFGEQFNLMVSPNDAVVFVTTPDSRPLGTVQTKPVVVANIIKAVGPEGAGGLHTCVEVVALLEELLSRQYDQTKARVLTMIEAILGKSNLGSESEGRLLNYLMEPARADLLRIVRERAPEVATLMDERRKNPATGGNIGPTAPVVNVTVNGADIAKEVVGELTKAWRRGLGVGGERKPREIGTETYTMP